MPDRPNPEPLARALCASAGLDPDESPFPLRITRYWQQAERILADPGPLLEALASAGVLERDEDALIHYRHGVNSGTLRARNTPESIAAAVRQYEQATHGPAGVERIETRTTFAHTTEWRAAP